LLLEQRHEAVYGALFGPVAEIEERGSTDDHGYDAPDDDALAEAFAAGVGDSVFIQVSGHLLDQFI